MCARVNVRLCIRVHMPLFCAHKHNPFFDWVAGVFMCFAVDLFVCCSDPTTCTHYMQNIDEDLWLWKVVQWVNLRNPIISQVRRASCISLHDAASQPNFQLQQPQAL